MITTASYAIYKGGRGTGFIRMTKGRSTKAVAVRVIRGGHDVSATLGSLPLGGEQLRNVGIVVFAKVSRNMIYFARFALKAFALGGKRLRNIKVVIKKRGSTEPMVAVWRRCRWATA